MTPRFVRGALAGAMVWAAACSDSAAVVKEAFPNAPPRRLIAGDYVACALTSTDKVFCWGANTAYWEYGVAPSTLAGGVSPTAAAIPDLVSVAAGVGTHYCGIRADREAVCWGRGHVGQLGGGTVAAVGAPATVVAGHIRWGQLSVSRLTSCGRSETGDAYCWGFNQHGEVGSASVATRDTTTSPSLVDGGHTFTSVAAGWLHACGIATDGRAWCWGDNNRGQLGVGSTDTIARRSPVPVSGGLSFTQLSLGSRYSCGITTDSLAYCWGDNPTGQLGDGTLTQREAPTPVSSGRKFIEIAASSAFASGSVVPLPTSVQASVGHTCALSSDKLAYCWGWNANGEVGDGTTIDRSVPTAVSDSLTFTTIAVGGAYSCGMNAGFVWCWGSNLIGQIGRGSVPGPALTPRAVLPPFGVP